MHKLALSLFAAAALGAALAAQTTPIYPELGSNNFFRAVQGKHATTNQYYPVSGNQPSGYNTATGVVAGERVFTHNPVVRTQAGTSIGPYFTVLGMTQAVQPGAAITTWPAPNAFQFKTGIAPSTPTTAPAHDHATTGSDLFSIAAAPLVIPSWNIMELAITLTTPVPFASKTELLLFGEYTGGEYREDPNGGHSIASDWQGGNGIKMLNYSGMTTATIPRVITRMSAPLYRSKLGLLVQEPTLTITGDHANNYYQPRLQGENYRGLTGSRANWATATNGTMFFDVRAGAAYGSTGTCVVFMNIGPVWFPGSIQVGQFGNLVLDPSDPGFGALLGMPLQMLNGGNYNGEATPIMVPTLGPSAVGQYVKVQGVMFNSGFTQVQLTTASALLIEL